MMATWQRSGRVGRAGRESLTALVAMPDALDQYFLDHPEELLSRPCEPLIVDPANEPVTRAHLICAASELPLGKRRDREYLERHAPLVGDLLRQGEILPSAEGDELYSLRRRPQRDVHLRGSGATYTIEDSRRDRVIGTVDGVRALHECHPGAVYLHFGRQYLVEELDLDRRRARAAPARLDYFTTPLTTKETEILELLDRREDGPLEAWLGRLKVTERVIGYERKRIQGQEVIDQQPLDLPPTHFETVGLWWAAGPEMEETLRRQGEHFLGALHATEHAAISLFPLLALCDRGDIGGISLPFHPQVGCGAVFVYDGHPGGVGIAGRGFADLPQLLGRVLDLVSGCTCETGCPSCIQSPKCGNGNRPLDKPGAARVLRLLLGREEPVPGVRRRRQPVTPIPPPAEEETSEPAAEPPRPEPVEPPPREPQEERPARRPRGRRPPPRRRPRTKEIETPALPAPSEVANTVLFDLETLRSAQDVGGWSNSHKMGVAVGVTCHLEEGRFEVYREDRVGELIEALRRADLVVGFNVKRFDYAVLSGYTGVDYNRMLPTLDLLDDLKRRLGFRVGLDALARATLGVGKSADGLQSLEWVQEGRLDLVEDYCRRDVEVLRDLYLHGRREGWVGYRDKRRDVVLRVEVEW
jgi:DEAD/DEAH box helicase domain-containing protein